MERNAGMLPEHRDEDYKILLAEGKGPPFVRNYRPLSGKEHEAMRKYIEEHPGNDFIQPSSSAAAAPVLLVRKPDGGLQFCVYYRELNDNN